MALPDFTSLLEEHPSIKHYTPASQDFDAVASAFLAVQHKPPVILRPQSAADVAAIITHCTATSTPFVVRSGGHDVQGRSQTAGALRIDMRDIAHVDVAGDRKTARVGGGVLFGPLLKALSAEGLVTPMGSVPDVGYAGWATLGGYGPTMPSFGLGVDQIVGARVVNYKGEIVEADEELLEALRGGGGNFGVVVELTIKVYPEQEVWLTPFLATPQSTVDGNC